MKNHSWITATALAAILMFTNETSAAPTATSTAPPDGPTETGFGVGFVLGTPSGVTASLPIGKTNAFDFVVGYDLSRDPNLTLLGDYVWHQRDWIPVDVGKVSVYYGPGARVFLAGTPEVGIRAVAGIDYLVEDSPIQAFLEVCPGVNILPNTHPNITAGIGLRYFF